MSLNFLNQKAVAFACKDIFNKFGFDPNFMENRMCGLTSSINTINQTLGKNFIKLNDSPKILEILFQYNNAQKLTMGKLIDPDTFHSFDAEGNMFHNAAICIFQASGLSWLPIFNPKSPEAMMHLVTSNVNCFLSINNQKHNGSRHLVCLSQNYLVDPEQDQIIFPYIDFLKKHWVNWSSVLVSQENIDQNLISKQTTIKPVFRTQNDILASPPGTSPWPAFIPDVIVQQIKNVLYS